ncbi:hypothetical protein [Methanolobus sp. WCC4]|uniref:hypothetical protein n=1 Tax=Methanolobus sp. WCC4 TaxID=3125784 RepID=UPI0030FA9E39
MSGLILGIVGKVGGVIEACNYTHDRERCVNKLKTKPAAILKAVKIANTIIATSHFDKILLSNFSIVLVKFSTFIVSTAFSTAWVM